MRPFTVTGPQDNGELKGVAIGEGCGGRDLNPRTTKDRILSPAPLARLGYPRFWTAKSISIINPFHLLGASAHVRSEADTFSRYIGPTSWVPTTI